MPFTIERCYKLKAGDIDDLCAATETAIEDGIGFNWVTPPPRELLEKYWKGVLVIPERELFVARLDGAVAGAVQLAKPGKSKESMAFAVGIENHFVAPWARGHGMAKALLTAAGFAVKEVPEGHLCCGSAGTYNLLQPTIAGRLKARKVANIESTRPDVIATGNIGCMTQIAGGTAIPVVHTVELLDWATGGPLPPALASEAR